MTIRTRIPLFWFWPVAAPALVAVCLLALRSVPAVFALYHVGLCLVVPAVLSRRAGLGWRDHLRALGLEGRAGLGAGLAIGLVMFLAPPAAFALRPDLFPDAAKLRAVLGAWSVGAGAVGPMLAFMGLVNAPAEELFWRGWLQGARPRAFGPNAALVLLFASYHAATTGELAPGPGGVALMLTGVVGAAAFWAWSRARWGTVWVALLSHWGATVGYLGVCWWVLGS